MSIHSKYFCLGCKKVNACSCGTDKNIFIFSHKLRPPTTNNKVKWRQFFDDCPQFANCVPPSLHDDFVDFVRSMKYKKPMINGRTLIKGNER